MNAPAATCAGQYDLFYEDGSTFKGVPIELITVVEASTVEVKVKVASSSARVSKYELPRLENIRRNEDMLRQLNIQPATTMMPKPKPRATRGLGATARTSEPLEPRNRSRRLAGQNPDGSALPADFREPSMRYIDEASAARYDERHTRKEEMGIVEAVDVMSTRAKRRVDPETGEEIDQAAERATRATAFVASYGALSSQPMSAGEARSQPAGEEELIAEYGQLAVAADDVAKVVPERIFSIAFHPSRQKLLVAVGDKWGKVSFFDPSAEHEAVVTLFAPHSRPVSSLHFDPHDHAKLYSSSYDNTVRCFDAGANKFVATFTGDDDDHLCYVAFDKHQKAKRLLTAFNDGTLGLLDALQKPASALRRLKLHDKKISHVDVHPTSEHLILTASNDCSAKIWDLRKCTKPSDALQAFAHGRACTSAIFSPHTGDQLVTTSYDDTVVVQRAADGCGGSWSALGRSTVIKHDNQTGRWLTNFKAQWDPKNEAAVIVGSMQRGVRGVDVFHSGTGGRLARLEHENYTTITSLHAAHPTQNALVGGNSSGKVFLWR